MQVNLIPEDESVDLFKQSDGALAGGRTTPVVTVLDALDAESGKVLRQGRHALLIDIEPESLEKVMRSLDGWIAEPLKTTRNATAFEGVLSHLASEKKK